MSGQHGVLMLKAVPLTAAAVLACVCLALAPTALASSFVIQGDTKIGGYAVKSDGTLLGAIEEFGRPTRMRRDLTSGWNGCEVRWRSIGLRIYFYNLGGRNPCAPQYGHFRDALITGKRWRTAYGLRIGHPWTHILRYPDARPSPTTSSWWWLVTRWSPYGDGGSYGALMAKLLNGRVTAFAVYYPAGGD